MSPGGLDFADCQTELYAAIVPEACGSPQQEERKGLGPTRGACFIARRVEPAARFVAVLVGVWRDFRCCFRVLVPLFCF